MVEPSMLRTRIVTLSLGTASLAILALPVFWWWCSHVINGEVADLLDAETAKIVINDEDLAAWMVINNTFTDAENYWGGVVIQLGQYQDREGQYMDILGAVTLLRAGTIVRTYTKDQFERSRIWINTVAQHPGPSRGDPMTLDDLANAHLDPPVSLHQYFNPYKGGITFWQCRDADHGYRLKAKQLDLHNRFTFLFNKSEDKIRVTVYDLRKLDVCYDDTDPNCESGIDEIVISEREGPDHGNHKDPPR